MRCSSAVSVNSRGTQILCLYNFPMRRRWSWIVVYGQKINNNTSIISRRSDSTIAFKISLSNFWGCLFRTASLRLKFPFLNYLWHGNFFLLFRLPLFLDRTKIAFNDVSVLIILLTLTSFSLVEQKFCNRKIIFFTRLERRNNFRFYGTDFFLVSLILLFSL